MKKFLLIVIPIIIIIIAMILSRIASKDSAIEDFAVKVESGTFIIDVITTGELEAINSEYIRAPLGLRNIRIHQIRINDMVPEGTVVDSGAYVATLDNSDIIDRLKDAESDLERLRSQFTQTQLDTTLRLRQAREELVSLEYNYEERQLVFEQSEFEPPATIRKNEIELERAKRAYEQAVENYKIRHQQARADMREVAASLSQVQRRYDAISELLDDLVITAPKSGMVIYQRNWDGERVRAGSAINTWHSVVATLPDLSSMVSRTFVNEIDINRVRRGQKAMIEVDAFPEQQYTGVVTEVANIGEQRPNSDARVFEVRIEINESDTILRPAMTTKNRIITDIIDSALYIPLEAIHNEEGIIYVFKKSGSAITKNQIITGKNNTNEVVILAGLSADDFVLLTIPPNADDMDIVMLDSNIIDAIDTASYSADTTDYYPDEYHIDEIDIEIDFEDSLTIETSVEDTTEIEVINQQ